MGEIMTWCVCVCVCVRASMIYDLNANQLTSNDYEHCCQSKIIRLDRRWLANHRVVFCNANFAALQQYSTTLVEALY